MSSRKLPGLTRETSKSVREGEGVIKMLEGICIDVKAEMLNKKRTLKLCVVVMNVDSKLKDSGMSIENGTNFKVIEGAFENKMSGKWQYKIPVFAAAETQVETVSDGGKKPKKNLYCDKDTGMKDWYTFSDRQLVTIKLVDTKVTLPQLCWVQLHGVSVTRKIVPELVKEGIKYPPRIDYYVNATSVNEASIPIGLSDELTKNGKIESSAGKTQRDILTQLLTATALDPKVSLFEAVKSSQGERTTIPLLLHGSNRWVRIKYPQGTEWPEWKVPSVFNILRNGLDNAFSCDDKTYYDIDQPQITALRLNYTSKKIGADDTVYLFDYVIDQFRHEASMESVVIEECGIWGGLSRKMFCCENPKDYVAQAIINSPKALVFVTTKGSKQLPIPYDCVFERSDFEWERDMLKPTSSVFKFFDKENFEGEVESLVGKGLKYEKADKKSAVEVSEVIPLHRQSLCEQGEGLLVELKHGKHLLAMLAEREHMIEHSTEYGEDPDTTYVYTKNVRAPDYSLIRKDNKWNAEEDSDVRNLKELASMSKFEHRSHDVNDQPIVTYSANWEIRSRLGFYGVIGDEKIKELYEIVVMPESEKYGEKRMIDIFDENQQLDQNKGEPFINRNGKTVTKFIVLFQNLLLHEVLMFAFAKKYLAGKPESFRKRYATLYDKMFIDDVSAYAKTYEITDFVIPSADSLKLMQGLGDFSLVPYTVKIPILKKPRVDIELKRTVDAITPPDYQQIDVKNEFDVVESAPKKARIEDDSIEEDGADSQDGSDQ